MSSGGKGRTNKGSKGGTDRSNGGGPTHGHQTKSDHNHNEKDKDSITHKIAPTAEQLRIAQMIDNTHSEKVLQEKINQVTQVTGVTTDDAIVALFDCDNDVNAAIETLLEGEGQGEWRESTKKKKKAPVGKQSKEEAESNKENRRVENRERSGSRPRGGAGGGPPRFRGRGRGGREETSEGVGRGSGGRRGRMPNGTIPASRGRGGRGRGSSVGGRTFQKRQPQPPGFTETIDTWAATPEKVEDAANSLQIDNWDDERNTTEDWDGEWTGSLDKTTVFSPSASIGPTTIIGSAPGPGPVPVSLAQPDPAPIITSVSNHTNDLSGSLNSVLSGQTSSNSSGSNSNLQSSLPESVSNVLSLGQAQQQLSTTAMSVPQSYSNVVPSSSSAISHNQSQTIDLAALLQKAAPHSTLGRLSSAPMVDNSTLSSSSLGVEGKTILSGISSSVGDSLKSGILANSGGPSVVTSSVPQSYSPSSAAINNSIFSNSVSNLGSSLNSGSGVNKVLGLSSQSASLASRSKPPRSRMPHSSKIPSKAVEMPEVAMAALDMQFTGLEFGTETFDFTSDVKPSLMGNSLVSGTSVNNRDTSIPASVSKDLSALSSTISQPQPLGPQPIPFPSQSAERKPQSSILSGAQRSSAAATASSQSLAELTKKDTSSGGPSLGSIVGSTPTGPSPYQSSSGSGYGHKASSFPSPPAHYTQNPSQSYSNNSSSGVSNSSYATGSVNSNSGGSSSSNQVGGGGGGGGYGSTFTGQVSAAGGQYPNNYVNVSSHSLASMSVTKTHGGLKDSSQNYNDTAGTPSNLSGSLSTSANSGSGLSASLSASTSNSVQPSNKPSVPGYEMLKWSRDPKSEFRKVYRGKTVNNLGSAVPPGVQQHSVSQQQQHQVGQQQLNQHHQTHHHLQQQQQQVAQQTQQTQQLMAGPSQYVSPQQAALQGALPPPFYNVQQPPAMYSFEDLQLFQQRIPHMPQAPSSLPGGREGTITSPPSYSVTEANKFRTDQNSSPVPSTINQQSAAAGATYITAPGNAAMPPFYMYQTMPAVPSTFSQYGAPAIIQIPSNTHTGSTTTQFPGPPKLPYGGTSNYYDNMSQNQDYKTGYGSGSQGQNKTGPNSSGSASNSGTDLTGYKNHISKVSRNYDKQAFHTGTPPPFNLAGSGTSPMPPNYTPTMFIPTMAAAAQHHSPLIHHQLHQDGGSSAGQRTATGGGQNKGASKGTYSGSYWTN